MEEVSPNARIFLAPVIESMNVIRNGQARGQGVLKSANNLIGCHILRQVVVPINKENTTMLSPLCFP